MSRIASAGRRRGLVDRLAWEPPGPDHPERLAAPLHLEAAAVALFDRLPDSPAVAAVDAAVEALEQGRARLAERLPISTELTVDAHRVRLAAACPAAAADVGDTFGWSPATAARHLGLRAVALHLCGEGRPPIERAVSTVVAQHARDGGERTPGPWLAQLAPAGRAVAQAQAQRWAEQVLAWVPLRLVPPDALRFLGDDWWPGGARGHRALVIHGRHDITVEVGRRGPREQQPAWSGLPPAGGAGPAAAGRPPGPPRGTGRRVAVSIAGGTARRSGEADVDALSALAAVLCDPKGRVVRVVRVHPASGEVVATDVTARLLQRGVDVVLATASALAAGDGAARAPGPACTWCHRQDGCEPGTSWLRRPDRRAMGLPVPAAPGLRPDGV